MEPDSTTTTTERSEIVTAPVEFIDADELLVKYGFSRCDPPMGNSGMTEERRQEIYQTMVNSGIGSSASLDPGSRVSLFLNVLNEESLAALAEFAEPEEVCVQGQDPNDFVEPGPQALSGDGWRWVGAAGTEIGAIATFVDTQVGYDAMWRAFQTATASPVGGPQPAVDFDSEIILTLETGGRGVQSGSCGVRFDGYELQDDVIAIDWFTPGGDAMCPASYDMGTYAIALRTDKIGALPYRIGVRTGPRHPVPNQIATLNEPTRTSAWPLTALVERAQALLLQQPPPTSELADAVECNLFRNVQVPLRPAEDTPAQLIELVEVYLSTIEQIRATNPQVTIERSAEMGNLELTVGKPNRDLDCAALTAVPGS